MSPRLALASSDLLPPEVTPMQAIEDALVARGATVAIESWNDPSVDWGAFDLVVIRATWDYNWYLDEFVAWAETVGERLQNSPALVRWNADKHYLGDLAAAGIPVVATTFVEPGDPVPPLEGEVVVKPAVSAGARDTGRFGPGSYDLARQLLQALAAEGRTAMVQPYYSAVDTVGETAVVMIDGRPSHTLHKLAVLRADEIAPIRDNPLQAAEAMYDPDLVKASEATDDEIALASAVVEDLEERFGEAPLYARVDLVTGPEGTPVLMEVEAVEPDLYHDEAPDSAGVFADAILRRVTF